MEHLGFPWKGVFMKSSSNRPKTPFRYRVAQFMYGRNGTDQLGTVVVFAALFVMLLEIFTGWWWLYFLTLGLLIYSNFRLFSRNLAKRRAENAAFCSFWRKIKGFPHSKTASGETARPTSIASAPIAKARSAFLALPGIIPSTAPAVTAALTWIANDF